MSKGKLLVISGPSGVGKGTIVNRILKARPKTSLSVSCTTRAPRPGEREGESYFFLNTQQFLDKVEHGGFLEYSKHFENYYGTPREFVESKLKEGDVILEIDVDGALNVKAAMPEAVLLMIAPPDRQTLKKRLAGRGTESEEVVAKRLERADYELSKSQLYDYVIINDELEEAVGKALKILET